MWRSGVIALAAGLLWFVACAGTTNGGGTQTNWLPCRQDQDCPRSYICVEGRCRDAPKTDDAGSDATSSTSTNWLPPPGPYTCQTTEAVTFSQGDGQCAVPPIPASSYCVNACWDQPGAPGPEGCIPSVMEEFGTRCCCPGGCCYDDGKECTSIFLGLGDNTTVITPPCSASSTTPERIYQGTLSRVVLTQDSIVINDGGTVTYVAKDTCIATQPYSATGGSDLAVTAEAVYMIRYDAVTYEPVLFSISPNGVVTDVSLAELFGGNTPYAMVLISSGTSVYVLVQVVDGAGNSIDHIVEIPCCGSAPRLVASNFTAWRLPIDSAAIDGQKIVVGGQDFTLDSSQGDAAGMFDLATNQATLLFDFHAGFTYPFTVGNGRVYFPSGESIIGVSLTDCAAATVVTRPTARQFTAVAVDGGDFFWAEAYETEGSRLFARKADGTEMQLAEVSGDVLWIGVDSGNVYWTMGPGSDPASQRWLVRRSRP